MKRVALCVLFMPVLARAQSVTSVEPAAAVLPANTLRFYFTFDRPARGLVHQAEIELLDSDNKPRPDVFMDFGQELWSPDGTRLTVLFDPGKVKRGVEAPGSERSPLEEGQSYRIVLGRFSHAFRVTTPVRTRIDSRRWSAPSIAARSNVVEVEFDRVMDAALVEDQLRIEDASRRPVPCTVHVTAGGKGARFELSRPLEAGRYVLTVGELLEDVAGNRMNEALDHAVTERIPAARRAEIRFDVTRARPR